jgi:predicted dehydrogenase
MNDKLRFGIVGCGVIANSKHMPSLKNQPEATIVAFCDVVREKAEKAALEYGSLDAKVFTDYRELLKEDIDVVHVCVPNRAHCEITVAAFAAGEHVFCEKPMAANAADAQKMIDAWEKTDRKFTIGFQWRFRPETLFIHDICEKGEMGEIYSARAQSIKRAGVLTYGSYLSKEAQGGGALIDSGSHSIDLTLWFMNNYIPVSVSGSTFNKLKYRTEGNKTGPWNPDDFTVEESAFGHIKMENGASIFVEASWLLNIPEDACHISTISGTKGGADLLEQKVRITKVEDGKVVSVYPHVANADPSKWLPKYLGGYEASHWVRSIVDDTEPLVSPYEALVVSKIVDAVYASAETGKTIYFGQDEFRNINQKIQQSRSRRP